MSRKSGTTFAWRTNAKVDIEYFDDNVQSVLDKHVSLKDLVTNFEGLKEYQRLMELILQLTEHQSMEELKTLFPGQFEMENITKYKGALIGPKVNDQGEDLEDYCKSVLSKRPSDKKSVVCFEVLDSKANENGLEDFDVAVINRKTDDMDEVIEVVNVVVKSSKLKTVLILFGSELDQSSALSYIRNQQLPSQFVVTQILFDSINVKKVARGIHENLKFGILINKNEIVVPPLAMYNQGLSNLKNVVSKICPPGGSVAYVSESDLPLVKLHSNEKGSRNITYFAVEKTIKAFQVRLAKERHSKEGESEDSEENSQRSPVESTEDVEESTDEKKNELENFSTSEDSEDGEDDDSKSDHEEGDVYDFKSEAEFDKKINETLEGYGKLIQDMDEMAEDIKKDKVSVDDKEASILDNDEGLSRTSSTSKVMY